MKFLDMYGLSHLWGKINTYFDNLNKELLKKVNKEVNSKVSKSGDTIEGDLEIWGNTSVDGLLTIAHPLDSGITATITVDYDEVYENTRAKFYSDTGLVVISGVAEPIENTDAANKRYVDDLVNWEFIKSDTFTEDTNILTVDFEKKYKELYIRLIMPAVTGVNAGRIALFASNRTDASKRIFVENSDLFTDTGKPLSINYAVSVVGNYATLRRHYNNATNQQMYASSSTYNTFSGFTDIGQNYLDVITLSFTSSSGTRSFPTGTVFEIWGVKA